MSYQAMIKSKKLKWAKISSEWKQNRKRGEGQADLEILNEQHIW